MQKTRGTVFLEVTGGPHQATVQSGFGVCGNRDQGGQEKVIRGFPEGPAGAGTPLSGKAAGRGCEELEEVNDHKPRTSPT